MPKHYKMLLESILTSFCKMAGEDKSLTPEEVRAVSSAAMACLCALVDTELGDG